MYAKYTFNALHIFFTNPTLKLSLDLFCQKIASTEPTEEVMELTWERWAQLQRGRS